MSESTLSRKFSTIAAAVGYYLGYGRDSTKWSAQQTADVNDCLQSGLASFYHPPVDHEWSFLRPTTTLPLVANTNDYQLPDNFGGPDGDVTLVTPNVLYHPIRMIGEGRLRELRMGIDGPSLQPEYVAVWPLASDGTTGQRWEMGFWPSIKQSWTVAYRYHALQNALITDTYPLGGEAHGETILESCLAIAEQRINDGVDMTHRNAFAQRLAASVIFDKRRNTPPTLGYNGDGWQRPRVPFYRAGSITHT